MPVEESTCREALLPIPAILLCIADFLLPDLPADGIIARSHGTEPVLIFSACDKSADHRAIVIRHAIVQDIKPELIAVRVRVAPEITEVLHQHESVVVFGLLERGIVGNLSQCAAAPVLLQSVQIGGAIGRQIDAVVGCRFYGGD